MAELPVKVTNGEAAFRQTDVVPDIVAVGNGVTVTLKTVGLSVMQEFRSVYPTEIVCAPTVFQLTKIEFVPRPEVMVPPDEIVHE